MADLRSVIQGNVRDQKAHGRSRHIQGIRALCLVYVLLFHFEIGGATFGFLGVDMFFVISGFVMTKSICRSLFQDTFSLLQFFRSRYWRLCPALFVTCAFTLLSFSVIWEPSNFYAIQKASLYSMAGLQNIHEMTERFDYFSFKSKSKPLLHVWSLSLEQQFYAIYAFGMAALYRVVRNRKHRNLYFSVAIVFSSLLFFLLDRLMVVRYPSSGFYFIFKRFYEFGFGCVLYFLRGLKSDQAPIETELSVARSLGNELMVILGLLLPTAQVFEWLPDKDHWRWRVWSLVSVCMLIDTSKSRISRIILANSAAVAVGEASYTIYLLHLPIWNWFVSFYACSESSSELVPTVIVALSFFSVMSFCFVEKPFRERKESYLPGFSFGALVFFICLVWKVSSGYGSNFEFQKIGNFVFETETIRRVFPVPNSVREKHKLAQIILVNGKEDFSGNFSSTDAMFIGNSFALQHSEGARLASKRLGKKIVLITKLGCRFDIPIDESNWRCGATNEFIWNAVMTVRPKVLLIGHRWEGFVKSRKLDSKTVIPVQMIQHFQSLARNFSAYGMRVVILGTTPAYESVETYKNCRHLQGTFLRYAVKNVVAQRSTYTPDAKFFKTNELMKRLFSESTVSRAEFLDLFSIFCKNPQNACRFQVPRNIPIPPEAETVKERVGLWDDGIHISLWGSWASGVHLDRFLQ